MTGIYCRFHRWRGFALTNAEPDLFSYVYTLGFFTVHICKRCLFEAYEKLRATIVERVAKDEAQRARDADGL